MPRGFTRLEHEDLSVLYALPTGLVKPYLCFLEHRRLRDARVDLGLLMHKTGLSHTQAREAVKALEALGLITADPEGGWVCTQAQEAQPSQRVSARKPVRKGVRKSVRKSDEKAPQNRVLNAISEPLKEEKEEERRENLNRSTGNSIGASPAVPPVGLAQRIEKLRSSEAGAMICLAMPREVTRRERLEVLEALVAAYPTATVLAALEEIRPRLPQIGNPAVYLRSVCERLYADRPPQNPQQQGNSEWLRQLLREFDEEMAERKRLEEGPDPPGGPVPVGPPFAFGPN